MNAPDRSLELHLKSLMKIRTRPRRLYLINKIRSIFHEIYCCNLTHNEPRTCAKSAIASTAETVEAYQQLVNEANPNVLNNPNGARRDLLGVRFFISQLVVAAAVADDQRSMTQAADALHTLCLKYPNEFVPDQCSEFGEVS